MFIIRLNSTHYLIIKISNKRELKNIAINHSADIDYKDFVRIYRDCTKEPCSFFDNLYNITSKRYSKTYKNVFNLIKMTVTDQVKTLDNKIKSNQTQYDLDRELKFGKQLKFLCCHLRIFWISLNICLVKI